jgi:hypothetical protein
LVGGVDKRITVLDERNVWWRPLTDAGAARGYVTRRINRGHEADAPGLGFLRPHAAPTILQQNHTDYHLMADHLTMIQDWAQVEVYEDKSAQFWRWGAWMPPTWRFENKMQASEFIASYHGALVSKADVGASSYNVRVLHTQAEQLAHVQQLFTRGISVTHCAGGPGTTDLKSIQRGYVLLQEYIPHDTTFRVNRVGRARAIFKRYNAPGTLTAQTGNVDGVKELDDDLKSLLHFADGVFDAIGSKWCALDILKSPTGWRMIETSLAWPWPSPGNCMEAQFFGSDRRWSEMWELLLDEYEAGVWST